ncbi:MAG TPA: hypothetical protein VFA60_00590 [Terriglobales bacterium]|nr:hypothetical protein [Terriglobales bacterium]
MTDEAPEQEFDWEEWPERRAEMVQALDGLKKQAGALEGGQQLDPLRAAMDKFRRDMENVIRAGDEEYRMRHPGAKFDSN